MGKICFINIRTGKIHTKIPNTERKRVVKFGYNDKVRVYEYYTIYVQHFCAL